jgi:hypothetical protein
LADGEMLDSSRARAAAGPGDALAFHFAYEAGADVAALPGGQAWPEVIGRVPEHETHLAVHDQHLVGLNDADEAAWAARSWAAIPTTTVTGSARQLRQRLSAFAAEGITEIVYQPTGPDTAGNRLRPQNRGLETTSRKPTACGPYQSCSSEDRVSGNCSLTWAFFQATCRCAPASSVRVVPRPAKIATLVDLGLRGRLVSGLISSVANPRSPAPTRLAWAR